MEKDGIKLKIAIGQNYWYFKWSRPKDWVIPIVPFLVETEFILTDPPAFGFGVWIEKEHKYF